MADESLIRDVRWLAESGGPAVVDSATLQRILAALTPTPGAEAVGEHIRRQVGRLDKWRARLSYNESYVGEPAGEFKAAIRELAKAVAPIYPPDPAPPAPLVPVAVIPHPTTPATTAGEAVDAPPIPAWLVDACQSRVWAAAWEMSQRAARPQPTGEGER